MKSVIETLPVLFHSLQAGDRFLFVSIIMFKIICIVLNQTVFYFNIIYSIEIKFHKFFWKIKWSWYTRLFDIDLIK